MKAQNLETNNDNLSGIQLKTFKKFQRRLKEKVPDYHIAWVHPYSETIIKVGVEPEKKMTIRKTMQASRVATEVEDEMGITIVLL
ncbi:MAG: hypothetical protein ACREOI_07225 [bacterium]